MNERVERAIIATPKDYLERTLASRAGSSPDRAGSYYVDATPDEVLEAIYSADWRPYQHPSIQAPAVGFRAEIPGMLGVVHVAHLPAGAELRLAPIPKLPEKLELQVVTESDGIPVRHSVMLLGPHEGMEVVWTFHPGDPTPPSQYSNFPGLAGAVITPEEALSLGLSHAKIVKS